MEYLAPTGYNWYKRYASASVFNKDFPSVECALGWHNSGSDYMLILPTNDKTICVFVYPFDVRKDAQNALNLTQHF